MKKYHLRNLSIIPILVVLLSSTLGKLTCVKAIKNNQKSLPLLLQRQSPLVSLDGSAGSNRGTALGVEKNAFTIDDVITGVSGGECCDSTLILLSKVGVGAAIETTLMYQLMKLSINITTRDNNLSSLTKRIIQTTTLLLIIFASSTFGSVIDMGLSAASKQVLDPNSTPNEGWYRKLEKPVWNPPGWVFPIMWLIVSKPTQFIAVSKVMDILCSSISSTTAADAQSKNGVSYLPLLVYCTHLSLGDAWNKVFFGLQCTGRGLAVILIFWSVLWTSAYLFYQVDKAAGLFLVPTGLWVTVAAALNGSIYVLNK